MIIEHVEGVPEYEKQELFKKRNPYCILIPVINEGGRILAQLTRAKSTGIDKLADIIICDGGSTDGSMDSKKLTELGVCQLLTKLGAGKQGAQLRTGIYEALSQGYDGVITIDGNNKDSIESVPLFIDKLTHGYDLVQGSRFIQGGVAQNTPIVRWLAVRLIHAPIISLTAGKWYTDTTNAYRAYSRYYLTHPDLQPLRDIFTGYELLAYLSVKANKLGLKSCEVPVERKYPKNEIAPTKIKGIKGNTNLLSILIKNLFGAYNPKP